MGVPFVPKNTLSLNVLLLAEATSYSKITGTGKSKTFGRH
jgi:hypothetical protein